jgi:hypothetical protein
MHWPASGTCSTIASHRIWERSDKGSLADPRFRLPDVQGARLIEGPLLPVFAISAELGRYLDFPDQDGLALLLQTDRKYPINWLL